jgi:hypothetical protein
LVAASLPEASGIPLVPASGKRLQFSPKGTIPRRAVLFLPPPAIICPVAGGSTNGRETSAPKAVSGLVNPNPQRHECRFQNAN